MNLALVTAPAELAVSLAEAKAHLAVTHALDDGLIQLYLDAAISHLDGAEGVLGRCLVTQTWDCTLDAFASKITVPLPTLQSVTSVKYRDADGAEQTVSSSDYQVSGQVISTDVGWPGTDGQPGAVTIRFVAGYGAASAVPAAIKAAILLYVGDAYANREASGESLTENPAALRLLRPFKVFRT